MTEERTAEKRGRFAGIGWRSVAIASAAAVTGVLALVVLSDPAPPAASYTVGDSSEQSSAIVADPLRAELARCRTLPANSDDARCREAWEVNRRRFMGESRSTIVPVKPPLLEREPIASGPSFAGGPVVAAPAAPATSEH